MQWEHQRLFQVKNQFLEKPVANGTNLYGNHRDLSNGNSNCTYSTEDGNGSEYFNNLSQFKRNDLLAKGGRLTVPPPDGASSLNQSRSPRSPRFSDRYKHRFGGSVHQINQPQVNGEWFDHQKEPVPSM